MGLTVHDFDTEQDLVAYIMKAVGADSSGHILIEHIEVIPE
jgi:hypothetical protein